VHRISRMRVWFHVHSQWSRWKSPTLTCFLLFCPSLQKQYKKSSSKTFFYSDPTGSQSPDSDVQLLVSKRPPFEAAMVQEKGASTFYEYGRDLTDYINWSRSFNSEQWYISSDNSSMKHLIPLIQDFHSFHSNQMTHNKLTLSARADWPCLCFELHRSVETPCCAGCFSSILRDDPVQHALIWATPVPISRYPFFDGGTSVIKSLRCWNSRQGAETEDFIPSI
jgi:hypothetical protein